MFHDDSMKSFFRRLSFTPDGSLLLTPGAWSRLAGGCRAGLVLPPGVPVSHGMCGLEYGENWRKYKRREPKEGGRGGKESVSCCARSLS